MMKTVIKTLLTSIALMFAAASGACAADLGTFGKTYPIVEPDAVAEMKQASERVDWGKYFNGKVLEDKVREYRPPDHVSLPKAARARVRQVDMIYSLPYDIGDPNTGEVVYPKGFSFNPLDYMAFHRKVVVMDGSDKEQVDWFIKSGYAKDPMTVLLITDGVFYEVSEKVKRSVFFATDKIVDRFKFEYVPSVAYQNLRMMEVVEIDVKKND